ncbi:MAG: DUF302 domain-containing protein, partial [Bryobacteraceae bacterium]
HPTVSELIPTMLGELQSVNGAASRAAPTQDGMTSIPSKHSVDATVDKLTATLTAKGVKIFAVIDHSGEAEKAGMKMRNTKLVVFGNPKGGTPLMLASPTAALDLPLKILVWEDGDDRVWLTYNSVEFVRARHHLAEDLAANISIIDALALRAAE